MTKSTFLRSQQNEACEKQNSYNQQGISNVYVSEKILNVHNDLPRSDKTRETTNPTIPNGKLAVNNRWYSSSEETPNKPGATSKTPNHPEVKLTNIKVVTSRNVFLENSFTNTTLAKNYISVNDWPQNYPQNYTKFDTN